MIILETANYLGRATANFSIDGFHLSLIEYPDSPIPEDEEKWHMHKNAHLTFFLTGGTVEHRKHHNYERCPGDVAFYHAGEEHLNTKTRFPSKNINLELEPAFFQKYNLTGIGLARTLHSNFQVRFNLLKLYKELLREDANTTSLHMIVLEILQGQATGPNGQPKWVKLIKEYVHDNWDETPSLDQLSQISGVHPVTISKNFTRYFHCTLGEYLRKIKIEKATFLIKSSSHTLNEIGITCGFADKSHFARTFKTVTGFSAGEFRSF